MRARVEPRPAPCQPGHMQLPAFQIRSIDVRDLEFAASRRAKTGGDVQNAIVVKVQASYRVARFRYRGLLLDGNRGAVFVQFDYPVTLRITNRVRKDRRADGACCRRAQILREMSAVE